MALYGQVATRTSLLYAFGIAGVLPISIVSLAVTTRYLPPSDFGVLAALLAVSSLITVLGGVGFLQGMMMAAYRLADDEEVDAVAEPRVDDLAADGRERRRYLGSGVLIVATTTAALCLLVAFVGGPVAATLLDEPDLAKSVALMALAAWTGSIWRTVHQIYRLERRPIAWSVTQWMRPALVVIGSLYALKQGLRVNGVLIATAGGTALSVLVVLIAARRLFVFGPKSGDIAHLWNLGKRWIPLILASTLQGVIAVLVLAAIGSSSSLGLYAAASRIAMIPTYFADGYLMGWAPLERSPIALAGKDRKGAREFSGSVFTLFVLCIVGVLVVVALSADLLIQVAAPEYASAAALIPVIAVGNAGFAVFRGLYRAYSFPRRRYWFVALHLIWLVPFAGAVALLSDVDAAYSVAAASAVASLSIVLVYVRLNARSEVPTPIPWTRLGVVTGIALACVVAVRLAPATGLVHLLIVVCAIAAFPFLLLATGGLHGFRIDTVLAIAARAIRWPTSSKRLAERLAKLPPLERTAITLIAAEGGSADAAAKALDVDVDIVLARLARGLRSYTGRSGASRLDHEIGKYVLSSDGTLERDGHAHHLIGLGVDPVELHVFEDAMRSIERAYRRRRALHLRRRLPVGG